ncbi:Cytochrome P450 4V2 [Orchesella cincta]|uniref:Cytochrome P450 4V2 n=1 Tax=Orchesella cincta TaxID=48709 RepID=A0A1D2M9J1_ORCCI|nr:Cytochrome P450 4V2 [Orchesella cincta]
MSKIFDWLEGVYKKWGDIARFWIFGSPKVFINSYDIAMQLLSRKNFLLKSEEFLPLAPIAQYSLPGASPQLHPIRRKMLGPGFNRQTVEKSFGIFNKHAQALCHRLEEFSNKHVVLNALTHTGLCSYMIGCDMAPIKVNECYLDLLLDLEEKKELTKEDVLHELNLFIVAGYDTTGTTSAWALHLLASHPECQEKALKELKEIFGTRKGSDLQISLEDIKRMKYLDGCIKEALRLYPVLPWLLRRTDEEIRLNDGTVLPEGLDVPINTFLIQRDPNFFPEPDLFWPERHFPGSTSNTKAMLPFGAGPRICPGMLFGMHELKILLAHLLLAYSWESLDNPKKMKCVFHGVLLPKNGINLA